MTLEIPYANGQLAALFHYKIGATKPLPAVRNSTVNGGASPPQEPVKSNVIDPAALHGNASIGNQANSATANATKIAPSLKTSQELCTSCRKNKHYGSCTKPRPISKKKADFNAGMTADDVDENDGPSTSPHYHSATSSSALSRSPDGRPADEQAASNFADLYRHLGISNAADEPGRMYGGLNKVASYRPMAVIKQSAIGPGAFPFFTKTLGKKGGPEFLDKHHYRLQGIPQDFRPEAPVVREMPARAPVVPRLEPSDKIVVDPSLRTAGWRQVKSQLKLADFMLPGSEGHSMHEQRGPSVNPYEERRTRMSPPAGWGDEGPQRIERAFDQIDNVADTTNIGGGFGEPDSGPAVLG